MSLNTVTLTWDFTNVIQAGESAFLQIQPTTAPDPITNAAGMTIIDAEPVPVSFTGGAGSLAGIIACDNAGLQPTGWGYAVRVVKASGTVIYDETVILNFANGASQDLSGLTPAEPVTQYAAYMLQPSGTPTAGEVPVATGTGQQSAWGPGGGGGGGAVASVNGKTGVVVLGASDVGADASGAAAAAQAASLQKTSNLSDVASASTARTNLGLGTAATQASSAFDAAGAASAVQAASAQRSANLSDLANTGTARTNLGLGTAAVQPATAFDAAGAAAAAQAASDPAGSAAAAAAASLPLAGGTMSGPVAMGGSKITGLANGTASTDAAAFGQIPAPNYDGVFGDGSDGSVTLDGTVTVGWANKASSVYTLNRDAYLTSLTINSGVTLNCGNYRIFAQGTVANNGTISANGNAGSASGTAGGASSGSLGGGQAGGAGNTGAGSPGTGGNTPGVSAAGAGGANGGTGGGAGGAGGNSSGLGTSFYRPVMPALNGLLNVFATARSLFGGPGGGGGGGDGANKGGGGGSGGGPVVILAWSVINNGTITTTGGAGGTPAAGNAGGGGGGSAGLILIYTLVPWTAGTTVVTGGAAGSGAGSGSPGAAGGAGSVLNVVVQ